MFRTSYELSSRTVIDTGNPSYDPDQVYDCDMCSDGGWCSETEVNIHKNNKHSKERDAITTDETKHACKICVIPHKNEEELLKHIKTQHLLSFEDAYRVERDIFICNYCSQIFFNKLQLAVHITYCHIDKENGVVTCPRCFKSIRIKSIWIHYEKHNIQSVSSCKICLDKCKNREHLKEHIKSHLPYYKCEMCGYMAKKHDLFQQHIKTLHKDDEVVVKEGRYKKYFAPQVLHWSRKLQGISAFRGLYLQDYIRVCVLCREICTSTESMKHHILVEHNKYKIMKTVFLCNCGESFTNKVLFKHHLFKMKGHREVSGG
ncbi:unnamed protein product [Danaus chrysippus]|uniref:(African queen) hypothetical protein n=1 Tax=Danaus chrysippus TaxID=151541 RepID=A0A8J2W869_9NEOP|nr:unnamed protein product [Danaus chrysippus]